MTTDDPGVRLATAKQLARAEHRDDGMSAAAAAGAAKAAQIDAAFAAHQAEAWPDLQPQQGDVGEACESCQ